MPKDPEARVHVRVPQDMKIELEQRASQAGLEFSEFIRRNWQNLLMEGKVEVDQGARRFTVPNPYWPNPFPQMPNYRGVAPGMPIMGMPTPGMSPYPNPYGYTNPYMRPQPDALDQFVNEMRKMAVAKMFMGMINGQKNPEQLLKAAQGKGGFGSDMSLEDIMKYKMLAKDEAKEMNQLMMQFMTARASGDKSGEDKAMQMMIALMANQANANQLMMQMNMQQNQSSMGATRDIFSAALGAQKVTSETQRMADKDSNDKYNALQLMMQQMNMNFMQQMFNQQAQWAQVEMQRIRDQKDKSPIDQLAALMEMREGNPVYKAAFNAALGVKDESTIGKLLPQLKEWGVDKVIEKVGNALAGLVIKPPMPAPGAISPTVVFPPPSPLSPAGASPMGQTFTPPAGLQTLHLPGVQPQQPTTEKPPETPSFTATPNPPETKPTEEKTKLPDSAIGYTNFNRPGHELSKPKKE